MSAIINGIAAIGIVTGVVAFWVGLMLLMAATISIAG